MAPRGFSQLLIIGASCLAVTHGATYPRCWLKDGECLDNSKGPLTLVRNQEFKSLSRFVNSIGLFFFPGATAAKQPKHSGTHRQRDPGRVCDQMRGKRKLPVGGYSSRNQISSPGFNDFTRTGSLVFINYPT